MFVADGRESGARELVCQVSEGKARAVLPEGSVAGEVAAAGEGPVAVRVVVAKDGGRVEVGGKVVWTGTTGLSARAERSVGVKFVAKGNGEEKEAVVESVRVKKGAKAG